ncbi:MAG: phosphoribosylaminoimidazole-succinocarboxamide synthase [Actinomycetota bacterium]|nr:MAG: phosphoribosylaminoimidazole-succinocarboxamide synthase [Actinomycetota bacterium]
MGRLLARGKVRDLYEVDEGHLLLVATDRISAFDVVLPDPIPDKGRVLTGLSLHWFDRTTDLVANHLVTAERWRFPSPFDAETSLSGRAMLVRRARVVPIECVARGYLAGSGWAQYRERGAIADVRLPAGLVEADRLPEPIFTPTTKAAAGHDEPLTLAEAAELVGRGLVERLAELTIALYERIAGAALERGIIVADTKLEFGFVDGELVLVDEVGTPDSSRFWPADAWTPGRSQPSFDKQFVRDWLDASGWNREPPAPALPPEVVARTAGLYREAYERISGERFDWYLQRMGALSDADWESCAVDLERLRREHAE